MFFGDDFRAKDGKFSHSHAFARAEVFVPAYRESDRIGSTRLFGSEQDRSLRVRGWTQKNTMFELNIVCLN